MSNEQYAPNTLNQDQNVMPETFETFMAKVAYWYLTDPEFQPVVEAAGIDFEKIPSQGMLSVKTVKQYLANLREIEDHKLALSSVSDAIPMLENLSIDLKIPKDFAQLGHLFKFYYRARQYEELGRELQMAPECGKLLLEEFNLDLPSFAEGGNLKKIMKMELEKYKDSLAKGKDRVMLPGFDHLSNLCGGFNPGRLTLLTGKTGFGKTNLGLNLALASHKVMGTAYINMEMSYEDIFKRFAVVLLGCGFDDLRSTTFIKEAKIEEQIDFMMNDNLFMTDGKSLSVKEIFGCVKVQSRKNPIRMLIIDYDQRLGRSEENIDQEWRHILKDAAALEDFAKTEQMHVILMCQLNEAGHIAASKRMLNIAHLWLDFYSSEDLGVVIHAKKNRHGPTNQAVQVEYKSAQILEGVEMRIKI